MIESELVDLYVPCKLSDDRQAICVLVSELAITSTVLTITMPGAVVEAVREGIKEAAVTPSANQHRNKARVAWKVMYALS